MRIRICIAPNVGGLVRQKNLRRAEDEAALVFKKGAAPLLGGGKRDSLFAGPAGRGGEAFAHRIHGGVVVRQRRGQCAQGGFRHLPLSFVAKDQVVKL